jgi:hypothetical protein
MCDPTEIIGEAAGNAVGKVLDSKPVENLLAPVTNELGLALGDIGSVFRFYASENLKKIFTKWAQQRKDRPIDIQDVPRVLPLLQSASLESDDELQDRWAALLESSVSKPGSVLPSFGATLSQMTADEAKFVDRLWSAAIAPRFPSMPNRSGDDTFEYTVMAEAFEPGLLRNVPHRHLRNNPSVTLATEQLKAIEKLERLELVIQDLSRLGILGTNSELKPSKKQTLRFQQYAVELPTSDPELDESTYFTHYGRSFIRAVTPSEPESSV